MTIPHEPWLVALSIAIAIQGSFVGLSIAGELDGASGFRRRLILAGASLTLATGVWAMHFVGMLAANLPSAVDYLVLPTLLSFLICVIVVGLGFYAAHRPGPTLYRVGGGALAMGLGVSLMHYVGMSAVHLAGPTSQEPAYVGASIVVSIAASAFALLKLGTRPTRKQLFYGALGLGLAISGMHYTAMAGMRLSPECFDVSHFVAADSSLSRNTLALLATVVAFGVSGAFLLSLVPDSGAGARDGSEGQGLSSAGLPAGVAFGPALAIPSMAGGGGPAPGLGVLPQRDSSASRPPAALRVERDGRPTEIAFADIYAIRANAHYTYVHDGEQEYFCNLSISAVEARLDPQKFLRVHRSHIVARERIARLRRTGETGVADLGTPVRCSIPVARGHYRNVKAAMDARKG